MKTTLLTHIIIFIPVYKNIFTICMWVNYTISTFIRGRMYIECYFYIFVQHTCVHLNIVVVLYYIVQQKKKKQNKSIV